MRSCVEVTASRTPTMPILPGQLSIGSQVTVLYAVK
jgi:hypothetical protein